MADNPSPDVARLWELPLLSPEERQQLLVEWGEAGADPAPFVPVHELFAWVAAQHPDATAVVWEGGSRTYRDLHRDSGWLAVYLERLGVGPGSRVGLCTERSPETVVGILGVLRTGAAYVPLDPSYPAERLAFMLSDAGSEVLLTQTRLAGRLPAAGATVVCLDAEEPGITAGGGAGFCAAAVGAEDPAYVIYTSGSTGRPKGVVVSHGGLSSYLTWALDTYPRESESGSLLHTSISFDLTVTSLFVPLLSGRRLEIARDRGGLEALERALQDPSDLNFLKLTPSHARALGERLGSGALVRAPRALILGGEALTAEDLAPWRRWAPATWICNEYGPTEATVGCSLYTAPAGELATGAIPIGRPIPGTRLYVLGPGQEPVPAGAPGELWIGGAGLAQGYLDRAELTAERFLPDQLSRVPGGRLYRSGDLVRWRREGVLEYLGRTDHQVKIRGFRIEPGEIEAALMTVPGVREAAVVLQGEGAQRRLTAWVAGREVAPGPEELRRVLAERLPAHMVPAAFVVVEALPLTPRGKVDRLALAARDSREAAMAPPGQTPPRSPLEAIVAELFAGVLGVENDGLGAEADFFALGGHSLLGFRLVSRARSLLGVELPLRTLFERPTVSALAAALGELVGQGRGAPAPPLQPFPSTGDLSLSFAQQRLFFLDRLDPGSAAYHIPLTVRLRGDLNPAALARGLAEVVHRHASLRTRFEDGEGGPVQRVDPPGPFPLPAVDLADLSEQAEAEALRLAETETLRSFDLSRGPLLRTLLLRLPGCEHLLVAVLHHIVSDGWSMGVLVRELTTWYAALSAGRSAPPALPSLPVQYSDYAVWQREWLSGEVLAAEVAHWRSRFADLPAHLELPADRPRAAQRSPAGAALRVRLEREATTALRGLASAHGTTLFMVLAAGLEVLLARLSGQQLFGLGTPVAGRSRVELEALIGLFVNTLVLRADLSGDPAVEELLERVREVALDAYAHAELPFEKLVEELSPQRSLSHTPLFGVMLVLGNAPVGPLELAGLHLEPVELSRRTAKLDLTLELSEARGGLEGWLEYSTGSSKRRRSSGGGGPWSACWRAWPRSLGRGFGSCRCWAKRSGSRC